MGGASSYVVQVAITCGVVGYMKDGTRTTLKIEVEGKSPFSYHQQSILVCVSISASVVVY